MKVTYETVVSNIGKVYDGNNYGDAKFHARSYVNQSKAGIGRAAGESVTVFRVTGSDVEIVDEYHGTNEQSDI